MINDWMITKKIIYYISLVLTIIRTIKRNRKEEKYEDDTYILCNFILPGSVCIDIGAASGRFTLVMSRLAGESGHIYGFEPCGYSYKVLRFIVGYYRLKNVTLIAKALSDKNGTEDLTTPIKKNGKLGRSMSYLKSSNREEKCTVKRVQLTTLDDYFSKVNISRLDFIKCDAEGAELLVFKGGKETLKRYKPVILCEINLLSSTENQNIPPKQIYNFFSELGYEAFIVKNDRLEKVNSIYIDDNYIFVHSDDKKAKEIIKLDKLKQFIPRK